MTGKYLTQILERLEHYRAVQANNGTLSAHDENNLISAITEPLQFIPSLSCEFAIRVDEALRDAEFLPESTKKMLSDVINAEVQLTGGV